MERYLALRALDLELDIARRTRRGRDRGPAADAGAAGARRRQRTSTCGRPSSCSTSRRGQVASRRARDRAGGARAQPAARTRSRRHRSRPRPRGAGGAAARAGRPAVDAARAAARHPPGGTGAGRRQRRDRRGAGRVLPAHQPDRLPRRPEPIALRPRQRRRRPVVGRARRGGADLQRRPHRRQRPLRRGGAARAGRALPARDLHARCATSSDALAGYRKTTEQRTEQQQLVEALDARRRGCRASATKAASTTTCRCSTRSATCSRASSISRACASRSSPRSSSCIARWAAAGRQDQTPAAGSRRRRRNADTRESEKGITMAKRMILMLVLMAVVHRRPGVREVPADPDGRGAGRGDAAAARSGHDHRGRSRSRGRPRCRSIGTTAAVQGVTVSADLPGHRRPHRVRVRAARSARATCSSQLDTRQEQAQLAAAEAQRELARLNFERMQGLVDGRRHLAGRVRHGGGRAEADRGAGRRDPRDDRAQDDPRAVLGHARHPPGQPRAVPRRRRSGRAAAVAASDLRELRRAAAGRGAQMRVGGSVRITADELSGVDVHRPRHRGRLGRRRGDAQRPGAGDAAEPGRQAAARHVRADASRHSARAGRSSRCRRRRSATRRTATRCSSSPT